MRFSRRLVLAWLLLAWAIPRNSQCAWVEEHAQFPFVLRADHTVPNAPTILNELAELQAELAERLGIRPAAGWIELYLFRDHEAFRAFVSRQFPGFESRRALFIQGQTAPMVLVARGDSLATDLRHESTHALLHAHTAHLPLWLDEGLAEYFEHSAEQRRHEVRRDSALFDAMLKPDWPRLVRLERAQDVRRLEPSDYTAAWAWARYLIDGPSDVQIQFRAYLAEAGDRQPERTMPERLSELNPHVEQAMKAYWQSRLPQPVNLQATLRPAEVTTIAPAPAPE